MMHVFFENKYELMYKKYIHGYIFNKENQNRT